MLTKIVRVNIKEGSLLIDPAISASSKKENQNSKI